MNENGTYTVHFTVSDSFTDVTNLQVTATSDNKAILPAVAPSMVLNGPEKGTGKCTATLQP
jgi:hypothetical protein